jgi:uncharacterized phage protein (TIGR02220 family)
VARIRTIKPNFFTSEDIVTLSPLARLLYVATWVEADREGRFVWRPKTLKLRYLPGDDCDIECVAGELVTAGLIATYKSGGQTYAEIPSFTKHQVINNRESASVIPARVDDASVTRKAHVTDATGTPSALAQAEGKGKEGKDVTTLSSRLDPAPPEEEPGNGIPYSKIVSHLNDKAKTKFDPNTKATRNLIRARWNEGHRLEQFLQVVDNMIARWSTDENMCQYLRPQTLFGPKFESYLQVKPPRSSLSFTRSEFEGGI